MKPLLLFLLLSTAAWGQDTTIKAELPDSYHFLDSDTARIYKLEWITPVQQDTIPVTILVRISGRPWAFFHDGWEVRKTVEHKQKYRFINGYKVYDEIHVGYLDSRKRPIRKEWVVYDKYSRQ